MIKTRMRLNVMVLVPKGYRWSAIQPWGELVLFRRKPKIVSDHHDEYWDTQHDELPVTADDIEVERPWSSATWKDSLRRIGNSTSFPHQMRL
jgi:hypothetical protein